MLNIVLDRQQLFFYSAMLHIARSYSYRKSVRLSVRLSTSWTVLTWFDLRHMVAT